MAELDSKAAGLLVKIATFSKRRLVKISDHHMVENFDFQNLSASN